MLKKTMLIFSVAITSSAYAHCPIHFTEEKVCLMLDQNTIFVYPEKGEHDGPYQDFKASTLESVTTNGANLKFSHAARGIYKIEAPMPLKKIKLEFLNNKKKIIFDLK